MTEPILQFSDIFLSVLQATVRDGNNKDRAELTTYPPECQSMPSRAPLPCDVL